MFFLSCSCADEEGQFLPSFAVEIHHFSIHGIDADGIIMDIVHTDRSSERMLLKTEDTRPFAFMEMGAVANLNTISIIPYPTGGDLLTKDEWQDRIKPWKVCDKGENTFRDYTPMENNDGIR